MSSRPFPPPGTTSRLCSIGNEHDGSARWAVLLALDPADAHLGVLLAVGRTAVVVANPAGSTWPNDVGGALATAIIGDGGTVALTFACIGDALACKCRLDGVTA